MENDDSVLLVIDLAKYRRMGYSVKMEYEYDEYVLSDTEPPLGKIRPPDRAIIRAVKDS